MRCIQPVQHSPRRMIRNPFISLPCRISLLVSLPHCFWYMSCVASHVVAAAATFVYSVSVVDSVCFVGVVDFDAMCSVAQSMRYDTTANRHHPSSVPQRFICMRDCMDAIKPSNSLCVHIEWHAAHVRAKSCELETNRAFTNPPHHLHLQPSG